jgi:teichuronic acid biosynthesis glycosyltransferase TuaG
MDLMRRECKNNAKVTIVIPCYNSEKYIYDAIYSVIHQSYNDWRIVIVDDSSSDSTVSIVKYILLLDHRISLIELNHNVGVGFARNIGMENSTSRFIAFLDSDDKWMPGKLKCQIEFMIKNNAPICFTSYALFNGQNNLNDRVVNSIQEVNLDTYLKTTVIGLSTSVIDTNIVGNKNRFIQLSLRQDADFWITLLKQGFIAHGIDEVMVRYRIHSESLSANKIKAVIYTFWLYFFIHRLGVFSAMRYYLYYLLSAIIKRR